MRFPRFSRRAPAPKAGFGWRWLYPLVLIGLGAGALILVDTGLRDALKIKDGKVTHLETDPSKPGFLAQVVPTPTMLVVEIDANNELIGAVVMSLNPDEKGGWALQVPAETRVDGQPLWQVWRAAALPSAKAPPTTAGAPATTVGSATTTGTASVQVDAGKAAVVAAIGRLLNFRLSDAAVLPTATMARMMEAVMPLTYVVKDRIQTVGPNGALSTLFLPGTIHIQKDSEVIQLMETITPGESPQPRLRRQGDLWKAWTDALAASPTAANALNSDSPALVRFMKSLAAGAVEHRLLPIAEEVPDGARFVLGPDAPKVATLAVQMVPFPLMVDANSRLRAALFNGTDDRDLLLAGATRLVESGAQIDVLGNAVAFGQTASEVVYYDPALETKVKQFARSLGIDVVRKQDGESSVDVTVTLGADFKG